MASVTRSRHTWLFSLGLIVLASIALRHHHITSPFFEPDESGYAVIARQFIHGIPLYRGGVDTKPPGIFLLYAAAMKLFGERPQAISLFCALYNGATVGMLGIFGALLGGPLTGLLAAFFFAIFSSAPRLLARSNTEIFMALPYVASVYFFCRGVLAQERHHATTRPFFIAGCLTGLAAMIKQVALTNMILFAAVLCLTGKEPWKIRLRAGVVLGVGAIAAGIPFMIYLFWAGAMHEFLRFVIGFNLHYATHIPFQKAGERLMHFGSLLLTEQAPLVLGVILLGIPTRVIAGQKEKGWASLWLATSFLGVCVGRYFFPHYFVQLLPALCLAAALGFAGMSRWGPWAAVFGTLLWVLWIDFPFYTQYGHQEYLEKSYEMYFKPPLRVVFPQEIVQISTYVREHSHPDDSLLVLSQLPDIYFFSQRPPATRFLAFTAFALLDPTVYREVVWDFHRFKPLYVVTDKELDCPDETGQPLVHAYRLELETQRFRVYRRPPS